MIPGRSPGDEFAVLILIMKIENCDPGPLPPPLPEHREPFAARAGGLSVAAFLVVIGLVITQWDLLIAYYEKWTRSAGAAMSDRKCRVGALRRCARCVACGHWHPSICGLLAGQFASRRGGKA